MSEAVDTEIQGNPGAVEGAASWLRDSLARELREASEAFNGARRTAESEWQSEAGDAFTDCMRTATNTTDDLAGAAARMAADLDEFAHSLRTCQNQMADVRSNARAAGLAVSGFLVQYPGDGPDFPPPVSYSALPEEVGAHDRALAAWHAHQAKLTAFANARTEAERIDRQYDTACRELQDDYSPGQHAAWIVQVADVLGDSAAVGLAIDLANRQSVLQARAQSLLDDATRALADMEAHPERYLKRKWIFFKTVDRARLAADQLAIEGKLAQAEDLLRRSGNLEVRPVGRFLGRLGRVLGVAGVAVGLYNDWAEGETYAQIGVSQGVSTAVGIGAGLGASALTGAAIGATFGSVVPGVGTAIGAVVGTVVGAGVAIFSDGMIDSFFENGPDVGKAFSEGADALADTGEAIADGVTGAISAVGGWFD